MADSKNLEQCKGCKEIESFEKKIRSMQSKLDSMEKQLQCIMEIIGSKCQTPHSNFCSNFTQINFRMPYL